MGWKLALCGGLAGVLLGLTPVSKTYYSDHVYVKYIPRIMFLNDEEKKKNYLMSVEHSRHDDYARELYARNYRRWFWRKPSCIVVGESHCRPLESEGNTK